MSDIIKELNIYAKFSELKIKIKYFHVFEHTVKSGKREFYSCHL